MAYASIGRRRASVSVYANVYDLSPANDWVLHSVGLGLYHTGVEILGIEYTFAATAGIVQHTPREATPAKFRSQILIGSFEGGPLEIQSAIRSLHDARFGPNDYDILQNNCNTFCNALCLKLCNTPIPCYINRIASYGVLCKCLIPREVLKGSPVNLASTTDEQRQESTAYLVPRNNSSVIKGDRPVLAVFTGTGTKLGGGESTASATTSKSSGNDSSLTDRREKTRLAAVARLLQQQQIQNRPSTELSLSNVDKSS